MSQFVHSPTKTYRAGEALEANRLVRLSSGKLVYADHAERPIGMTENEALAINDPVAIRLLSAEGTIQGTASAAITASAVLYGTDDGKIDDADPGSGIKIGQALEAATASGDLVEFLPALQF